MVRRLAIALDPNGELDRDRAFGYVRAADEAGVEVVFVPETWGRDAFSTLVQLADRTSRIKLGTGIVNVFSRSPAALAQHFATLDEISGGRAIAGLGTSGPRVIEGFHGVPFARPGTRLREVTAVLRQAFTGEPIRFSGDTVRLEGGFPLRFRPIRHEIPIYLATFRPAGVRLTAEVADGWMALMVPLERLADELGRFRGLVGAAGRDPASVIVLSPGEAIVASGAALDGAQAAQKRTLAFYLARMGDFYHSHLSEMGRAAEVAAVRDAWAAGGSAAGSAAVSDSLADALAAVGSVERCAERLDEQAVAGVDLHRVKVVGVESPAELGQTFARLVGG